MIHYQLITLIFRNVVTFIYGAWFIYIGIQHFIDPDWFEPIVPGFLLFPTPDFSKSLLVGIVFPVELFPVFISQSLLFNSFLIATVGPAIVIMSYDSIKRR